jgi:hypothetical protein
MAVRVSSTSRRVEMTVNVWYDAGTNASMSRQTMCRISTWQSRTCRGRSAATRRCTDVQAPEGACS